MGLWHQIIRTTFCWILSQVQFLLIGPSGPWRVSHSPLGAQDFPRSKTKSPVTQEPPPAWGNQTWFTLPLGKHLAPLEAKHLREPPAFLWSKTHSSFAGYQGSFVPGTSYLVVVFSRKSLFGFEIFIPWALRTIYSSRLKLRFWPRHLQYPP